MIDCSEFRFRDLSNREGAVESIQVTTRRFAINNKLAVRVVSAPDDIPSVPTGLGFKYGGHSGSLDDAKCLMEKGQAVLVVFVEENGEVVAYGFSVKEPGQLGTEVKIIDVAREARRSGGLYAEVELEGTIFQVGVAHVLVIELMESTEGPMMTDATNPRSRYVFKSLGFVHDDTTGNPCILRFG